MSFVVTGLPVEPFKPFFGLSDEALAAQGVTRYTVNAPIGFPCRLTLEDAPVGSTVLLLNYEHQPAETAYRSRHAIFVREDVEAPKTYVDEVPQALAVRKFISLRSFDAEGLMVDADVFDGAELAPAIERLLAGPGVAYLHAHNAGRGCFAARIDPA